MRTLVVLVLTLLPALASAQYRVEPPAGEPSEAELDRARERFLEGGQLVEQGRWADAVSAYEDSYRASGIPAALFNTGTTLRSMGRHRDARDAFRQLLALDGLDPDTREVAESRMREEAGRVALILLTGLAEATDALVQLDGQAIEAQQRDPVEIETDPGDHAVSVLRDGYEPWQETLTLEDAERRALRVELTPIEGESVWESPILWTIVAAVLVGGAVVGGVLAHDAAQLRPREGVGLTVEL